MLILDFGIGKGQEAIPALVRSLLDVAAGTGKAGRQGAAERMFASGILKPADRVFLHDALDLTLPRLLAVEFDSMGAKVRQRGRQDLVVRLVSGLAAQAPRLLVLEDLHWADADTKSCLTRLMQSAADVPCIVLATTRPADAGAADSWQFEATGAPTNRIYSSATQSAGCPLTD